MSGLEFASMVAVPAFVPSRLPVGEVGVPMMSASAVDMCRGDSRPSCCWWPLVDPRRKLSKDLGMTQAWAPNPRCRNGTCSVRHNAAESSENAAVGSEEVDGRWRRRVMMTIVMLGKTYDRWLPVFVPAESNYGSLPSVGWHFVLVVSALLGLGTTFTLLDIVFAFVVSRW